ncbi:MAG: PQQ-dependent sugar dehydrogenase, partial [Nitrospiria bacterium]
MEINAKLACYLLVFFVSITASGPVCSEPSNPESRSSGASGPVKIKLVSLADRLSRPVGLTHAGDGSHRLFIVEQRGTVRILKDGILSRSPFLDIRDRVRSGGEMGLLGLAFHPHFPKDRRFFVNYTSPENGLQTVISEFSADVQLEKADPASERRLLVVSQPFSNHNGGQIAFGLDGFLYIGTGDGGAGNDPHGNGQNLRSLLGKMLRIDVDRKDSNKNYAVPKDNPFTNQKHIAPEIWAYGLRNPWRFSFDTQTGDLLVGDVGQNRREEIDLIQRGR